MWCEGKGSDIIESDRVRLRASSGAAAACAWGVSPRFSSLSHHTSLSEATHKGGCGHDGLQTLEFIFIPG